MKIEFVTNASLLVTLTSGKQILTDPWYTTAYYGSWYNFPPVSDEGKSRYLSLKPDYIYISHIHPDHLDPETIKHYPKETQILIGKLNHNHLERKIRSLGFNNIVQCELEKPTVIDDFEIIIFGDFAYSSEGYADDVEYALDTSFLLKDSDGEVFFNINDNNIQVDSAEKIVKEYGHPKVATVPYSGASMFPHAFKNYSDDEKERQKESLKMRKLEHFVNVTKELMPEYVIPAAGSYVMGGKLAPYNRYLHQATPAEIRTTWKKTGLEDRSLCQMCEGDVLDSATGTLDRNEKALFRDFEEAERLDYSLHLSSNKLEHEKVSLPSRFEVPWQRLLFKARRNLYNQQKKLDLFPSYDLELHITNCQSQLHPEGKVETFCFALDQELPYRSDAYERSENRYYYSFTLDSRLMLMILLSAAIWNNAEGGAFVEVERYPDEYNPTVHSLMSYFAL